MTKEEREYAINFLKGYLDEDVYTEKCINAHTMAIKSLEQEPCEDAISRQAVLDGIDTYINKAQSTGTQDDFYSFAELVVKELPSVTPQEPFMNKPCVSNQVCHEDKVKVLDKIRAEILVLDDADYDFDGYYKAVTDALKIIDKYKTESEDKNGRKIYN